MNGPETGRRADPKELYQMFGRVLITGGAGFIGSHLAEALLDLGHEVRVVDDLSTGRRSNLDHLRIRPGFEFVQGDVTATDLMDELCEGCGFVFHLAAAVGVARIMERPVECLETNFLGARAVLGAARRRGLEVLVTSTSEIYGKSAAVPFQEDDDAILGPTSKGRWAYAASKMVTEFLTLAYAKEMGLPVVIARLFNTVGPRQTGRYGMVIPRFVGRALDGLPLTVYGDGRQSRCFLHVKDAVDALLRLAVCREARGRVFNVGSAGEVSIIGLARKILLMVDALAPTRRPLTIDPELPEGLESEADGRIAFIPMDRVYSADFEDMDRRSPDLTRIEAATGWKPMFGLDRILSDVIRHMALKPRDQRE